MLGADTVLWAGCQDETTRIARTISRVSDEFGWRFGLDEPYPRGQLNALLMMADIGEPGAWRRVFTQPNLAKFDQPTVSDVDFPTLGIAEAWNEQTTDILHIGTFAATASQRRAPTAFRITQLPDASTCVVRCDGEQGSFWWCENQFPTARWTQPKWQRARLL